VPATSLIALGLWGTIEGSVQLNSESYYGKPKARRCKTKIAFSVISIFAGCIALGVSGYFGHSSVEK